MVVHRNLIVDAEYVEPEQPADQAIAGNVEDDRVPDDHRDRRRVVTPIPGARGELELIATCPHCNKEFYGDRKRGGVLSNYHRHVRVHQNERPYACPDCTASFKTPSNLKRHRRIHRNAQELAAQAANPQVGADDNRPHNRRGRFICPDCQKQYASQWSLTQHQRRQHWQIRDEVECDACGQLLSSRSKLTRHQRFHCIFRVESDGGDDEAAEDHESIIASDADDGAEAHQQVTSDEEAGSSDPSRRRDTNHVDDEVPGATTGDDDVSDPPGVVGRKRPRNEDEERADDDGALERRAVRPRRKPRTEPQRTALFHCGEADDCIAVFRSRKHLIAHIKRNHPFSPLARTESNSHPAARVMPRNPLDEDDEDDGDDHNLRDPPEDAFLFPLS